MSWTYSHVGKTRSGLQFCKDVATDKIRHDDKTFTVEFLKVVVLSLPNPLGVRSNS